MGDISTGLLKLARSLKMMIVFGLGNIEVVGSSESDVCLGAIEIWELR